MRCLRIMDEMTPFVKLVSLCRRWGEPRAPRETPPGRGVPARCRPTRSRCVAFLTGRAFRPRTARAECARPSRRSAACLRRRRASGHRRRGCRLRRCGRYQPVPELADSVTGVSALVARASVTTSARFWEDRRGEMRRAPPKGSSSKRSPRPRAPTPSSYAAPCSFSGTSPRWRLSPPGRHRALARVGPQLFVPLLPMLAETATDFGEVLAAHDGRTALEYKYDGARAQITAMARGSAIWTRGLSDVTASLPDVAALVRRDCAERPSSWTAKSWRSTGRAGRGPFRN